MARHAIKHQVNMGVLHYGLLTDKQLVPGIGLALFAMGVLAAGGDVLVRIVLIVLLLLPVFVMAVDNQTGGFVREHARRTIAYRRSPGVYAPGSQDDPPVYVLSDPTGVSADALTDLYV